MQPAPTSANGDERPAVVVTVRPIATPLTLGFAGLAVISFVLSGLDLGWVSTSQAHTIDLIVLVFVVPLQGLSCIFGFLARDPAAAAGMGILAGTWAAFGASHLHSLSTTSPGLGLLLCAAAGALLVPASAALTGKPLAAAVLLLAAARFAVDGAYELTASSAVQQATGALGLAVTAIAIYAALAFELEGAFGRAVLPIGRRGRGREAMQGDFAEQMRKVAHEPGVRRPL